VLLLLAIAAVILGGVVLAALGRADPMVSFSGDAAPLELRDLSAAEIAMLRPPLSLWGYNAQQTDEVLQQIAHAVSARDVEIATLRRQLEELRPGEGTVEEDARAVEQGAGAVEQGAGAVFGHHEGQMPGAQRSSS
jgi:hypothetical protein